MVDTGPISLADGFEPAGADAWRDMVERGLKAEPFSSLASCTADGIELQPLYEGADSPALSMRPAGAAWRIIAMADHPDPVEANRQALRDLDAGATGLSIAFEHASSAGGFGLPADDGALAATMQDVFLDMVHLRIEPHPLGLNSASWLADLFETRSTEPARGSVSFGLDPVGNFARWGVLPADEVTAAERLALTTAMLRDRGFTGRLAEADGRSFHAAGASEAQELGAVLASTAWTLRALCENGSNAGEAFGAIGVSLAADQQQLVTIAKMRAMHLLWSRLHEVCGVDPTPLRLHAETARRMMMEVDPYTNILRATLAGFAAGTGGADSITILPHSWAVGLADRPARRIARNLHHLMLEESNLHRVSDPAAGSGAIEALTDGFCEAAWAEFRRIESEGGIVRSLADNKLQERIVEAGGRYARALADGSEVLVGATQYPDPAPSPVKTADATSCPDPVFKDAALRCRALTPMDRPGGRDGRQ